MEKVKIAVLGCAASKSIFAFPDKEETEKIYDLVAVQYESSIISIMSKKLDFNIKNKNADKNTLNILERDCNKIFLKEIIENKADYIIIDILMDILYGSIAIKDSFITNNVHKLKNFDLDIKDNQFFNVLDDNYYNILIEKIEEFISYCKEYIPETKILFNLSYLANAYYDNQRIIKNLNRNDIIDKNIFLKRVYDYLRKKDDIIQLDFTKRTYFSTTTHKWSSIATPIHYEIAYNREFLSKLDRIVLKSIIK